MREERVRCVGDGASRGENRGGGVGRGRSRPEPGGGGGRLAAVQGFEEALDKDNAISLTVLCQLAMDHAVNKTLLAVLGEHIKQ
jgi:hypothetical protein